MNIFTSRQYEFKTSPGGKFIHKIAHEAIRNKFLPLIADCRKISYFSDQLANNKYLTSARQKVTLLLRAKKQ